MKDRKKRWLLIKAMSLLLVAFVFVAIWFLYQESLKIHQTPINSWVEDHNADCGIVLTGSANRVREGFDLLAQKRIKKLIISGVFQGAKLEEIFPLMPYYGTVQSEDVVLEKNSRTTFGNAQQSLALVEALKCRDVVLITSYLHMRRALKTFKATFPEEISVYERATIGSGYPAAKTDVLAEATKSIFYSFFAYGPETKN